MVKEDEIWKILEEVNDPEVPVLSVVDLGVVRQVSVSKEGVHISITPTYSGCPAIKTMEEDIRKKLTDYGIDNTTIKTVLSPAWTTDWLSDIGKAKLKAYGIAPPEKEVDKSVLFTDPVVVPCPYCNSENTRMVSLFGSTACKAQYACNQCQEPYDYFKCLK